MYKMGCVVIAGATLLVIPEIAQAQNRRGASAIKPSTPKATSPAPTTQKKRSGTVGDVLAGAGLARCYKWCTQSIQGVCYQWTTICNPAPKR